MTGKRHKKPKSCSSKKAHLAESHVAKSTDLTLAAKSPQVNTLQSDENGGISEVWPSLVIENVVISKKNLAFLNITTSSSSSRISSVNSKSSKNSERNKNVLKSAILNLSRAGMERAWRKICADQFESSTSPPPGNPPGI